MKPFDLVSNPLINTPAMTPIMVTLPQAGQLTGLSRSELYRLLADGKLQAVKAKSRTLVLWNSIVSYVASLPAATFRAPRA